MKRSLLVSLMTISCLVLGRAQNPAPKPLPPPPAVSVQNFDPSHQQSVTYSDDDIQVVEAISQGQISVRITERPTRKERLINLPVELAQVDEIRKGVANKLIVRGMVNGSGAEIVVIDLNSYRVIDKFLCYLPSISSDGHYIAFVKFYPSHFAAGTDDHYMVYDVAKEPEENRPTGISNDDWKTVGKCIYPIGMTNKDNDNTGVPKNSEHFSKSKIFWNPHQSQLFFADQLASAAEVTLVLVDIGGNGTATVKTITQDTGQLCPSNTGTEACSILARKVAFQSGSETTIAVAFENVSNRKLVSVEYKSSQFQ